METGRKDIICPLPGGMRRKRAAELFGAGVGAARNRVKAYRGGGMAALRPGNGNAGQAGRPAVRRDRDAGDTEAPRRRVEEPEPGDAVMREVVEVAGKDPGAVYLVKSAFRDWSRKFFGFSQGAFRPVPLFSPWGRTRVQRTSSRT